MHEETDKQTSFIYFISSVNNLIRQKSNISHIHANTNNTQVLCPSSSKNSQIVEHEYINSTAKGTFPQYGKM